MLPERESMIAIYEAWGQELMLHKKIRTCYQNMEQPLAGSQDLRNIKKDLRLRKITW
jgi:hypothetical protein